MQAWHCCRGDVGPCSVKIVLLEAAVLLVDPGWHLAGELLLEVICVGVKLSYHVIDLVDMLLKSVLLRLNLLVPDLGE